MPDASDAKETVDGVVPSMLVEYTGNSEISDTTDRVRIKDSDQGTQRFLIRGGPAVHVIPQDITSIGGGPIIKIVETVQPIAEVAAPVVNPVHNAPSVLSPPIPPVQGQ